ncbi:hypothetical protein OH799_03355 [Nocardia sp. NBC_00881]|nr:hypothetical protein OH799_03355 [Nocardia sp. NBC_00881]
MDKLLSDLESEPVRTWALSQYILAAVAVLLGLRAVELARGKVTSVGKGQ